MGVTDIERMDEEQMMLGLDWTTAASITNEAASDTRYVIAGRAQLAADILEGEKMWWIISVQPANPELPDAPEGYAVRTQADSWEQALKDISDLFPPEE